MSTSFDIVADIGGTNARFACFSESEPSYLSQPRRYSTSAFPTIQDALQAYCDELRDKGAYLSGLRVSLAVAGPVEGDLFSFSNNHWSFSKSELKSHFGLRQLTVINDFTAQALSVLRPEAYQRRLIREGQAVDTSPILVLGPGTGLGVSALIPAHGYYVPLETEGGQVSLSAQTDQEISILKALQSTLQADKIVAEDVLSGRGLEAIYLCLGSPQDDRPSAADITEKAASGEARAQAAIHQFLSFLGSVIADGIVSIGARQAVYICGGITPKLSPYLEDSAFYQRISKHNHFSDYVGDVPVYLCDDDEAGLRGAGLALDNPALSHRHL